MGWWQNLRRRPSSAERLPDPTQHRSQPPPGVTPPKREEQPWTTSRALSLIPVYRAVTLIASSVAQLTLDVWRGEDPLPNPPTWVRKPDVKMSRSAWLQMTATSLATHGNAYWRVERDTPAEQPRALLVLDPREVAINDDGTFSHRGHRLQRWQVQHLALLRVPGSLYGLGPIQAAQAELAGTAEVRDYASEWFSSGNVPNGVLKSEQVLAPDQAEEYKKRWLDNVRGGEPAVMGHGLSYEPLLLSPKDAQFIESRQFATTEIARLFGVPAHLMHAVVEGGSVTYLNGQEADLTYVRWTLMQYLREIEEAVSELLPRGSSARFNVNAILRPATKARYEAHQIALEAGFLTVNEVRALEGLKPLEDEA